MVSIDGLNANKIYLLLYTLALTTGFAFDQYNCMHVEIKYRQRFYYLTAASSIA